MSEKSGIEWTDHTFNPWWGCAKISPGCDNCYALRDSLRYYPGRQLWGTAVEGATRRTFGDKHWAEPQRWNRAAERDGRRARVFCASMADVFDRDAPPGERERLWELIKATPHLDWLILTKRIGNAPRMLPPDWGTGYPNVWLGISVVNDLEYKRDVGKLCAIDACVRFLSVEPMLGSIDPRQTMVTREAIVKYGLSEADYWMDPLHPNAPWKVHWVIVGGESGPKAREMKGLWIDPILAACRSTDTAFFFKQGSAANWPTFKTFESFPPYLQLREWPRSLDGIRV